MSLPMRSQGSKCSPSRLISFRILSRLPSSGSKFPFNIFLHFRVLSFSFSLCFSEGEPFFFHLPALCSSLFASLCRSYASKNYDHLTPMYDFFFLLPS